MKKEAATTLEKEKQFEQLYERYFHVLLSLACKFVEKEAAKDLIQDIFFKLWYTPEKLSDTADNRFYLYTSVRNQCFNYIRNKKVEDKYRNKIDLFSDDFYSTAVIEEELFLHLQEAINNLPEKYREVIHMHLDGLKDKDIAEKLEITVDLVKTRKKRGREMLKDSMGNPYLILLLNLLINTR